MGGYPDSNARGSRLFASSGECVWICRPVQSDASASCARMLGRSGREGSSWGTVSGTAGGKRATAVGADVMTGEVGDVERAWARSSSFCGKS